MDINLKILRYNPETDRKGHWEEYSLDADPDERILDLLHKVKWFDDGSLAFRRSCAHGVCGSDAMVVNGENMLACQVLVKEVSNPIKIEPIRGLPVIWSEHYKIEFPILSDFWPHGEVAKKFGCFNDVAGISLRYTYITNEENVITEIIKSDEIGVERDFSEYSESFGI